MQGAGSGAEIRSSGTLVAEVGWVSPMLGGVPGGVQKKVGGSR